VLARRRETVARYRRIELDRFGILEIVEVVQRLGGLVQAPRRAGDRAFAGPIADRDVVRVRRARELTERQPAIAARVPVLTPAALVRARYCRRFILLEDSSEGH